MDDRFYKEVYVFSENGNDHKLVVIGEAHISPAEYGWGWNIPADFEVRNIESVFLVRHNKSKRREDIPRYATMIKTRELKGGEVVYEWEHHRPLELNSHLENEITERLIELFNEGGF